MNNMHITQFRHFFAGLDVGSLSTKAVLVDNEDIAASCTIQTGAKPHEAGEKAYKQIVESAGCGFEKVAYIVGTGYGRVNLPFAHQTVTELTCHARGANFLNPGIRTVIDIGGQDCKVIRLDQWGNMEDFMMNDRCAAGTGRFLEVIAKALELELEMMGEYSSKSESPCSINNTCAVFAESEVVSLLAAGHSKEDITAGIHEGIARRVGNMARKTGLIPEIAFVGGVAKNPGVRKAMEKFLEIRFAPLPLDPQITGALGAALLAKEFSCCSRRQQISNTCPSMGGT